MTRGFTVVLGFALLTVGLWGTLTGGHNHTLIIFGINTTHNFVHLASGAFAILAAIGGEGTAKTFCWLFGLVYGAVAVAGFLHASWVVALLNLNTADNILHLIIALNCLFAASQSKFI